MAKLRRTNRAHDQFPLAADVLEMRSMLSAGAVHAAMAHAHHDLHAHKAPPATPVHFAGPFVATINIAELGVSNLQFEGTFTKTSTTLTTGKTFSISFNQHLGITEGLVTINSISGAIAGKVNSINPQGGGHVVDIIPSGKFTVNVTVEGHTLNLAIVPKPGAHSTLTLDSGNNFVSLTGTYKLPTNAFLHGGDVNVSLVP